ncbi:MAG: hypothetical protein NC433_02100 [Clostridiales bacterium]|nr:hypothetical protein [Clostridiales bacterium]
MQFSWLEGVSKKWKDILVIGKTIERDGKKYHIIGMTMEEDARLYIIEPYEEQKRRNLQTKRTQRMLLKEHETKSFSYLHCREFRIGNKKLRIQGGSGGALIPENYEEIKLFLDMMDAGWNVPEWLKNEEWDRLQLVTLRIDNIKRLPKYSPDMPITVKHGPDWEKHLLNRAKTITLEIGKPLSFRFTAHDGEKVQCHINNVTLIDVWEDAGKQFSDAKSKYRERFTKEQLQEIERHYYEALEQNCPKGMCYIGIEYECSRDINLQFYSKDYLESYPESHNGSASFVMMRLKPDKKKGTHGMLLKGYAVATPFPPDTTTASVELLFYMEKTEGWEECVCTTPEERHII